MIVGAAVVELHVHGSNSLKAKRGVVRRVVDRLRQRFPLSVAEVGGQGTWQRAVIGLATVGSDARRVRQVLDRAVAYVEGLGLAEVLDSDVEILHLDVRGDGADGGLADDEPGDVDDEEGDGSGGEEDVADGRRARDEDEEG